VPGTGAGPYFRILAAAIAVVAAGVIAGAAFESNQALPTWARAATAWEWLQSFGWVPFQPEGCEGPASWTIPPVLVKEGVDGGSLGLVAALLLSQGQLPEVTVTASCRCGPSGRLHAAPGSVAATVVAPGPWDGAGGSTVAARGLGWAVRASLAPLLAGPCDPAACAEGADSWVTVLAASAAGVPLGSCVRRWRLGGAGSAPVGATIAVAGDSQSGAAAFRTLLAAVASRRPRLASAGTPLLGLLHLGDAVQSPGTDPREWRSYLSAPLAASLAPGDAVGLPAVPLLWVRGNHDEAGPWPALLPPPAQLVRLGPVAVLVVPSMGRAAADGKGGAAATADLVSALGRSPRWTGAPVRLLAAHVPPCVTHWDRAAWDAGESREPDAARRVLLAALRGLAAPAHAILAGHSHIYQRRWWRWRPGRGGSVPVITIGTAGGALERDPPVNDCPGAGTTVVGSHAVGLLRVVGTGGAVAAVLDVIDVRGQLLDVFRIV